MPKIDREKVIALHSAIDAMFDGAPEGPELMIASESPNGLLGEYDTATPGFISVRIPRGVLEKASAISEALDKLGLWSPVHSVKLDGASCGCKVSLLEDTPENHIGTSLEENIYASPAPESPAPWEDPDADGAIRSEFFTIEAYPWDVEFYVMPKHFETGCSFSMSREQISQALALCPDESDGPRP